MVAGLQPSRFFIEWKGKQPPNNPEQPSTRRAEGGANGVLTMATANHPDNARHSGGASEPFIAHIWHRTNETLHLWRERAVMRHELADLDDYILRDIGLTRSDVMREADKPFWKA